MPGNIDEEQIREDFDRARNVILDAIKNLPELQGMQTLVVANALGSLALRFASADGHEAARRMFRDLLKAVDIDEQDRRVN